MIVSSANDNSLVLSFLYFLTIQILTLNCSLYHTNHYIINLTTLTNPQISQSIPSLDIVLSCQFASFYKLFQISILMDGSLFNDPSFRYKFANRTTGYASNRLPTPTELLQYVQKQKHVTNLVSSMGSKRRSELRTKDQLQEMTKRINQRYCMNLKKAFVFEDSILAYTSFLANPNIQQKDIVDILNHIYDRYLFREYPEVIGCVIGQLIIYRILNPDERPQINRTIDKVYELARRDRTFCDMSKIMYFVLMDMWNKWGIETNQWEDYLGWNDFKEIQDNFWRLSDLAKHHIRRIWIELQLSDNKHEHQVVELLRRMMDFQNHLPEIVVANLFCFIFLLNFMLDEHKNVKPFSQEILKTLNQIISKLCYLPLNPFFRHMNAFLILYKLVAKERNIFGQVVLKMHLALRASPQFLRRTTDKAKHLIGQFKEIINQDADFTQYYDRLDKELEHVVELKKMVEDPSQFFSFGDMSESQRKEKYEGVFKLMHSQYDKPSESQTKVGRSILRAKPQIMSYAQQKLANLEYIELYLTLDRIHKTFMARLKEMCLLEMNIEQRHDHLKYLYTWFCAAYLKIMKHIISQENLLLKEGFMSKEFVQQMHSELISRMAELGIVDLDFKRVYNILYEEYCVEEVILLDFGKPGFAVKEIFDKLGHMGFSVGNPASFYQLLKLKNYFNTFVTKYYGLSKDPKRQQLRLQMRRTVDLVLKKKEMMMNRPQNKFVKADEKKNQEDQFDKTKASQVYKFQEELKYPVYYDGKDKLIKTTIFMIVQKMQEFGLATQLEYNEIFICIVTVLDNEQLLLDIYANMMFMILGSSDKALVDWGYHKLNLMRKSLSDKYRLQLPCSKYLIDGLLCIYERLRKIQINRQRWKSNKSKSVISVDKFSGKSKLYLDDEEQNPPQQSKIYQQYFEQLFQYKAQQILNYGKQLAKMKKYRQAVYVLEHVNERLRRMRIKQELDVGQDETIDVKQLEIKSIQCDIALCDCYAVLVTPFKDVQGRTKKVCIEERINKLKEDYNNGSFDLINSKLQPLKPPPNAHETLIVETAKLIKQQYYKNHIFYEKDRVFFGRDNSYLQTDDLNLELEVYCEITNYSMCEMGKLSTKDEFRTYYRNFLAAALMFKWYEERKSLLILRKVEQFKKQNLSVQKKQKSFQPKSQDKKHSQTYDLESEGQVINQSFEEILKTLLPHMPSPNDRLVITTTMSYCQQLDKLKQFSTIRLHNQAILEAKKIHLLKDMCQIAYNGQNYEYMSLLELETLQKYYFELGNYQHVKAITKSMLDERSQLLYTDQPSCFVSWPQVFCYDIQAKVYDNNMSSDMVVAARWHQFLKLIQSDSHLLIDGEKLSLDLLSDPNYLKQLRKKQPTRYSKAKKELTQKIRQYLKLLRIVFDNIELKCKIGINVFLVLQKIYQRFFIQQLLSDTLFIDFFYYYLRFLCEAIDCSWLEIENDAQFAQGMQVVERDRQRLDIRVEYMNRKYVLERTTNIVVIALENLQWIKHHFMYMTRAFDQAKNSKKNLILKKLLVEIVCLNPPQHIWNLAMLKNYTLKFPSRALRDQRPSMARTHKFQQRQNFLYDEDSILNKRHDAIIKSLYNEIFERLGEAKIEKLVEIPEMLMEILEINACDKAMQVRFSFSADDSVRNKLKEINNKIRQSPWRIPVPLNPTFYIKSIFNFEIVGSGKSVPTSFDFICRPYSEVKGDVYQNEKNIQTNVDDTAKSFIMKYNFSREDFMVETATANFYNEVGMLDEETTYRIVNLAKYILMIEKIQVNHCTMHELLEKACGIDELDKQSVDHARNHDVRNDKSQRVELVPGFYDKMKVQRHNPLRQTKQLSLFNSFYKQGLKKRRSIDEWWRYTDNFVRTLAQWSYFCYLTKLGDRHNQNILVTDTGKLIHIDYEYNFAHGLMLAYPEWVPFRLTEALVSAMGSFQQRGSFFGYFLEMAKKFDPNEEKAWKALGNFQPEQRKIVQSSVNFSRLQKGLTFEQACESIIDISRSDALLRLMYKGWLSCA